MLLKITVNAAELPCVIVPLDGSVKTVCEEALPTFMKRADIKKMTTARVAKI
jgi:hypothetical protein